MHVLFGCLHHSDFGVKRMLLNGINASCFTHCPIKLITECGLLHSFVSYPSPDAPLQGVQVSLGDIFSSLHGCSPSPCLQYFARGQFGATRWKSQQQHCSHSVKSIGAQLILVLLVLCSSFSLTSILFSNMETIVSYPVRDGNKAQFNRTYSNSGNESMVWNTWIPCGWFHT